MEMLDVFSAPAPSSAFTAGSGVRRKSRSRATGDRRHDGGRQLETTEVGIFLNDAAVSKLEYYLSTSVAVTCDPGAHTVTTAITMSNSVDRDDLTFHVLARRSPRRGRQDLDAFRRPVLRPAGRHDLRCRPGSGDAESLPARSTEGGRNAQSIAVLVDRGQTRTVSYTSALPEGDLGPCRCYSPTVTDTPVTIAPSCAELTGP